MDELVLYHTGFSPLPAPDVRYGRVNADLGQGFYLTPDRDFARRWAKLRAGRTAYVNAYALDPDGLRVKRMTRGREWFELISANRAGRVREPDCDVIVAPIANDTIYDTWGVLTSGLVSPETALRLLAAGPAYTQVALRTDRAAANLRFLGAEPLPEAEILAGRDLQRQEEIAYQAEFLSLLRELSPETVSILE